MIWKSVTNADFFFSSLFCCYCPKTRSYFTSIGLLSTFSAYQLLNIQSIQIEQAGEDDEEGMKRKQHKQIHRLIALICVNRHLQTSHCSMQCRQVSMLCVCVYASSALGKCFRESGENIFNQGRQRKSTWEKDAFTRKTFLCKDKWK